MIARASANDCCMRGEVTYRIGVCKFFSEAKITKLDRLALLCKQNVLSFDVPVDNIVTVQVGKTLAHLLQEGDSILYRRRVKLLSPQPLTD